MTIPALRYQNVWHDYGGEAALCDVSLDVAPGEIIALLGPSGCGKSTLLRVGAGLERQHAGAVFIDGLCVADANRFVAPERRGVGLMFQDYALFPHLDVAANVAFGLGRNHRNAAAADPLLARIGLADRAHAYPHMLSGGEQQRVALARALAPKPAILLMDEPFSNLDQGLRGAMRQETVALLRETAAAAVLVTHDPDDALAVADRIAVMRAGRLIQIGAPQTLFNTPADLFVARIFADFEDIEARVEAGHAITPLGRFAAPSVRDGPALVCIRRDAFMLTDEATALQARVIAVRFRGASYSVLLAIEGMAQPIEATIDSRSAVAAGETTGVAIERSGVLVFAGNGLTV